MDKSPTTDIKLEIWNSVTHGIGVIIGIVFLLVLLIPAIKTNNVPKIVAFSIYGTCFILMYLMSCVYHGVQPPKAKSILRIFDHSSIFLFIAGSYTPILLLVLRGWAKYFFLILIWTLAIGGIIYKAFSYGKMDKHKTASTLFYIGMGWMAVFFVKPLIERVSPMFFLWIALGGIMYTVGTYFYKNTKLYYHHVIWHFFVLAAAIMQFVGIYYYLA